MILGREALPICVNMYIMSLTHVKDTYIQGTKNRDTKKSEGKKKGYRSMKKIMP